MAEKYIMTAAKLIAPVIETSFAVGYDCKKEIHCDWMDMVAFIDLKFCY